MPKASGMKFHYLDHDTAQVNMAPPVQNTWYEVFHAQDVRLLVCHAIQTNTEAAAKNIEVRWTIDGTVYFIGFAFLDATDYFIHRYFQPSAGGTGGLGQSAALRNGCVYTDKRGQDFKVEVRITAALGTAQTLRCDCVYETLELT